MRMLILLSIAALMLGTVSCKKKTESETPATTGSVGGNLTRSPTTAGTSSPLSEEPVKTACELKAHDLAAQSHAKDSQPILVGCPAGCTGGQVWGTDLYTDDSVVCQAAIHAGAIPASGGRAAITFVKGQLTYVGSPRNGIASSNYGPWKASFYAQAIDPQGRAIGTPPTVYDDQTALVACDTASPFGVAVGTTYTAICASDCIEGNVWGSNPYTADSSLCAAARHAGLIDQQSRKFTVLNTGPQESFKGSVVNGVTSQDYGSYEASVKLSGAK